VADFGAPPPDGAPAPAGAVDVGDGRPPDEPTPADADLHPGGWEAAADWIAREADAGRPTLVNIFASWCGPCEREMPMLIEAADANPDIAFLGIDHLDRLGGRPRVRRPAGHDFPTIHDLDGDVAAAVGARGMPTTVGFDADGVLVARAVGELTEAIARAAAGRAAGRMSSPVATAGRCAPGPASGALPGAGASAPGRGPGGTLALAEVGEPTAPAWVLAHGVGSSARFVAAAFAGPVVAAGGRLVAYDLRGHGGSVTAPDVADHHLDVHVADLAAVVASVAGGSPPAVVGGISLGGHAAVRLVASGAVVPGGVLACLPAWTGRATPGEGPHAAVAAQVAAIGIAGILAQLRGDLALAGWLRRTLVTDYARHDPASLAAALRALDGGVAPMRRRNWPRWRCRSPWSPGRTTRATRWRWRSGGWRSPPGRR
jgi:cytochrome c biogenesis protein CcmG, thiol:disulfide interchange protein DsbE